MLNALTYMFDKSQELLKEELEILSEVDEDDDQDEDEAAKRKLFEDYGEAIHFIGEAYAQFVIELKQNVSENLLIALTTIATQMVAIGIKSVPQIHVSTEGIALFVDFA